MAARPRTGRFHGLPQCAAELLQFQGADADASYLVDLDTRFSWNAYGPCFEGPLKGTQLKTLILLPEFCFAWSQFRPRDPRPN